MQQNFDNQSFDKQPNVYKKDYSFLDSCRVFFYALLVPEVAIVVFMIVGLLLIGLFGGNMDAASKSPIFLVFLNIMGNVALLVFFIIYSKKNNINVYSASKFKKEFSYKTFFISIVMSTVTFFCSVMFINLISTWFAKLGYNPQNDLGISLDNVGGYLLSLFVLALLPAFIEECIYRGVVFNGIKSRFKLVPAVLMGAFCFMIMHGSLNQTVYQFVLGIILCFIMYYTDNILYCMVFHFVNNFIVITMEYITTATGTNIALDFGQWWQILLAIALFIIGAIIIWAFIVWLKKLSNKEDIVTDNPKERKLSKEEIAYMVLGVVFAMGMWLYMTIVDFL